jgi:hypothetical protein
LHLAASTMEGDVEQALTQRLESGEELGADAIKKAVAPPTIEVPVLEMPAIDLTSYDQLLAGDVGACV